MKEMVQSQEYLGYTHVYFGWLYRCVMTLCQYRYIALGPH